MSLKAAIVLAGCGRGDGSEITEAVSCLVHLSRSGVDYKCFAPDAPQADVVNHATGQLAIEKRNMLVEAARIARGDILPLAQLHSEDFDMVIFPGGFGAAKNLCTFAHDGPECRVLPDVERVIKTFHGAGKPIGLVCIAPVLAARVLGSASGGAGCEVTIGRDSAAAEAIAKMGARNVPRDVSEAYVDAANNLFSTPAYMCDAKPHEVFTGIGVMIDALVASLQPAGVR
ncbi:MAG: isoprenoid biosynthesis glyoxalase ElbB [Planctomycetota bacterium]|nr:isoprenoid biosynthesis glyoxalase ElbB [Planctomycetota bacterium]